MQKRLLAYLFALMLTYVCSTSAYALPPVVKDATINIAAGDQTVNIGTGSYLHIIIHTSTTAAIVYINLNNTTASATNFEIDPGAGLTVTNSMNGIVGFHYFGSAATGTLSYMAW